MESHAINNEGILILCKYLFPKYKHNLTYIYNNYNKFFNYTFDGFD